MMIVLNYETAKMRTFCDTFIGTIFSVLSLSIQGVFTSHGEANSPDMDHYCFIPF
jgi:hypothetical protein